MDRKELRAYLEKRYSKPELEALCFDLNIDHEQFPSKKTSFVIELIEFCERSGRYEELVEQATSREGGQRKPATPKLPEHDFAKLSDCHAELFRFKNIFANRLPTPQFADRKMEQLQTSGLALLQHIPLARRVIGPEWAATLANTVPEAIVAAMKRFSRDYQKYAAELSQLSPKDVQPFVAEIQKETELDRRLDSLLSELEAKLK